MRAAAQVVSIRTLLVVELYNEGQRVKIGQKLLDCSFKILCLGTLFGAVVNFPVL